MNIDPLMMTWLVPLIIAVFQMTSQYMQRKQDQITRDQEAQNKKARELISSIEASIKDVRTNHSNLERQVNRVEMEAMGTFLPRTEFADFLKQLDERFERDRLETMNEIKLTMRTALAEYRIEVLERRKPKPPGPE